MTDKKPLPVYLDDFERKKLQNLANTWGVRLSSAVKRLIREAKNEE